MNFSSLLEFRLQSSESWGGSAEVSCIAGYERYDVDVGNDMTIFSSISAGFCATTLPRVRFE